MKIDPTQVRPAATRRVGAAQPASSSGFAAALHEESGTASGQSAVGGPVNLSGVSTILALQGAPDSTERRGTKTTFHPDPTIFKNVLEFNFDTLALKLRELAYLNSGLTICIHDERTEKKAEYSFTGGIATYVADLNANKTVVSEVISLSSKYGEGAEECVVDIAMQWNDGYSELTTCFTNTIKNRDGGMSHDFAVPSLDAATNAINSDEQDAVTFDAPATPGTYEYVCRPHTILMKGTLRVTK